MMKAIVHYYDTAKRSILEMTGENKLTWATIEKTTNDHLNSLARWKFTNPEKTREQMNEQNNVLVNNITESFRKLTDK